MAPQTSQTQLCERGPRGLNFNHDVLLMFFEALSDRNAVLSLMHTCRSIYAAGIPRLLSFPVQLGGHDRISSFSDFILSNPQIRSKYVREIHIKSTASITSKELLLKFTSVLRHVTSLNKFTLVCNPSDEMIDALVVAALAHNESIRHLTLRLLTLKAAVVLQTWRAPVKEADIELAIICRELEEISAGARNRHGPLDVLELCADPTWVLGPFNLTLRKIIVEEPDWLANGPTFPGVTELVLTAVYPVCWTTDDLMRAFPNLTHLIYNGDNNGVEPEELREMLGSQNPHSAWKSLEYVQAASKSLYGLALPCEIYHLDLTVPLSNHNDDLSLETVLDTAQPSQLDLHFNLSTDAEEIELLGACLEAVPSYVTTLDITCGLSGYVELKQLMSDFINMFTWVTGLEIFELKLSMGSTNLPHYNSYMEDLDAEGFAWSLSLSVPDLEKITLRFGASNSTEWDVLIGEDGRQSVSLAREPSGHTA